MLRLEASSYYIFFNFQVRHKKVTCWHTINHLFGTVTGSLHLPPGAQEWLVWIWPQGRRRLSWGAVFQLVSRYFLPAVEWLKRVGLWLSTSPRGRTTQAGCYGTGLSPLPLAPPAPPVGPPPPQAPLSAPDTANWAGGGGYSEGGLQAIVCLMASRAAPKIHFPRGLVGRGLGWLAMTRWKEGKQMFSNNYSHSSVI